MIPIRLVPFMLSCFFEETVAEKMWVYPNLFPVPGAWHSLQGNTAGVFLEALQADNNVRYLLSKARQSYFPEHLNPGWPRFIELHVQLDFDWVLETTP